MAEGLIFVAEKLTEPVMSDDGTTVTTQGTIRVVISKGADRFKDFRGMTQADAKAALATAKYTAGSVEYTGYEVTSVVMQSSDVVNADEVMDYKLVAEAWTEPAVEGQLKPEYEPGYTDPATGLPLPEPANPADKYVGGIVPKPAVVHPAQVELTVSSGPSADTLEVRELATQYRGMALEDAIAALEALGYTVDRTLGIIEAESDPEGETAAVPAGSVITVKRNGAWSEDRDHRGAVTITVSKGMSAKATRALLFQEIGRAHV